MKSRVPVRRCAVQAAVIAPADEETKGKKVPAGDNPGSMLCRQVGSTGLNKYSRRITQPKKQGASQAMLYATGLNEEDMDKPQVLMDCDSFPSA